MTDKTTARNVRVDAFVGQMRRSDRAAILDAIERENVAELERAGIAKRIKQARTEAGLSQPEMAEAIGVIPRTYQNYESLKDPRTPWSSMNDIANVTGKTTEWLIHGRETPAGVGASNDQLDRMEANQQRLEQKLDRILSALDATLEPPGELGAVLRGSRSTP